MQVTLEIPDELATRLPTDHKRIAALLARGVRDESAGFPALRREVIAFLARGPRPKEILEFRPSESIIEHVRELRWRNEQNDLTPDEEAEMQELTEIDSWVSLLKAEARLHLERGS